MPAQPDPRAAAVAPPAQNSAPPPRPQGWTPVPWEEFAAELIRSHPHYRVTGLFPHHGGMGAVYLATDTRPDPADPRPGPRPIVIKMLRPGFLSDPRELARFRREIAILRALDHPNIVKILDDGVTPDGHHFFVMPYLGQRTLKDHVSGPRLAHARIFAIMQQLCAGVAHAHDRGIIHRDLKPSNVLLAEPGADYPEGRVVILDFGIARALLPVDDLGALTRLGDTPGTHGYLAPERKATGEAGKPADIFSLGVIFHQLVTGSIPDGIPAKLAHYGLDSRFDAIRDKALSQDPADRHNSASELAKAIAEVTNSSAIAPQAESISAKTALSSAYMESRPPDPASITIEFSKTQLIVNGLDFSLETTVEDWIQVLGNFSVEKADENRKEVTCYWQNKGILVHFFKGLTDHVSLAPEAEPKSPEDLLHKTIFPDGFQPFVGIFRLNGNLVSLNHDIGKIAELDYRFRAFTRRVESRVNYDFGTGRYTLGLISSRGMDDSLIDIRKFEEFTQDASEHYKEIINKENSAGNCMIASVSSYDPENLLTTEVSIVGSKIALIHIRPYHAVIKRYNDLNSRSDNFASTDAEIIKTGNFAYLPSLKTVTKTERVLLNFGGALLRDQNGKYTGSLVLTNQNLILLDRDLLETKIPLNERPFIECLEVHAPLFAYSYISIAGLFSIGISLCAIPLLTGLILLATGQKSDEMVLQQWPNFYASLTWFSYVSMASLAGAALFCIMARKRRHIWRLKIRVGPKSYFHDVVSIFSYQQGTYKVRHISDGRGLGQLSLGGRLANRDKSESGTLAGLVNSRSGCDCLIREYSQFALIDYWLVFLSNHSSVKFPVASMHAPHSTPVISRSEIGASEVYSQPTGWRRKTCSNCGSVMSRFAQKCQQPNCGHPNTWLKIQTFAANVALLLSALAGLFFGFLGFPLVLFGLALVWRLTLAGLKTFYSH